MRRKLADVDINQYLYLIYFIYFPWKSCARCHRNECKIEWQCYNRAIGVLEEMNTLLPVSKPPRISYTLYTYRALRFTAESNSLQTLHVCNPLKYWKMTHRSCCSSIFWLIFWNGLSDNTHWSKQMMLYERSFRHCETAIDIFILWDYGYDYHLKGTPD